MTILLQMPLAVSLAEGLQIGLGALLVAAVFFVVATLAVSHVRFEAMTSSAAGGTAADAEKPGSLELAVATRIGRRPLDRSDFLVALVGLEAGSEEAAAPPFAGALTGDVAKAFRAQLRRTDTVAAHAPDVIAAVVDAERRQSQHVVERLFAALRAQRWPAGGSAPLRLKAHAGVASSPENGTRAAHLIEEAAAALARVRDGRGRFGVALAPAESEDDAPGAEAEPAAARRDSLLDEVTGLLRAERLPGEMQKYVARFRKKREPVAVLYLDVAQFERYEELYGKEGATELLRALAAELEKDVRVDDLLGRHAEHAFVVVMPATCEGALDAAGRLVERVRKAVFKVGSRGLKVTMHGGVAGYPDHGGMPRLLFEAAQLAQSAASKRPTGGCRLYDRSLRAATVTDEAVDSL